MGQSWDLHRDRDYLLRRAYEEACKAREAEPGRPAEIHRELTRAYLFRADQAI